MRKLNPLGLLLCVGVLIGSTLLTGCEKNNMDPNVGETKYQIQADGCVVKAIENPRGPNFFIAKCPAESVTTTYQYQVGKSTQSLAVVSTSESLRKQLAEVEAKEKALSKLTDEEKKLLGVK